MNLHNLVRGAITGVNADEVFTLYRSLGSFRRDYETATNTPEVAPGETVKGQVQSISPDRMIQTERLSIGSIVRRVYLYAGKDPETRPAALYRPLARSGDYLLDSQGRQWLLDAILEDYSGEGWISAQAILQQPPQALLEVTNEQDP